MDLVKWLCVRARVCVCLSHAQGSKHLFSAETWWTIIRQRLNSGRTEAVALSVQRGVQLCWNEAMLSWSLCCSVWVVVLWIVAATKQSCLLSVDLA